MIRYLQNSNGLRNIRKLISQLNALTEASTAIPFGEGIGKGLKGYDPCQRASMSFDGIKRIKTQRELRIVNSEQETYWRHGWVSI